MPSLFPSTDEQQKITKYLDYKGKQIRKFIHNKRQLIKLMNEKKQAIINQAVTRGINPGAHLKHSNVEWMGDIPSHWGIEKLKHHFVFKKGQKAALLTKDYIGLHIAQYPVYSGQTENEGLMGTINWYEFDNELPVMFVTTVGAKAMTTMTISGKFSLSQNCALLLPKNEDMVIDYFQPCIQQMFNYEKKSISLICNHHYDLKILKDFLYLSLRYQNRKN